MIRGAIGRTIQTLFLFFPFSPLLLWGTTFKVLWSPPNISLTCHVITVAGWNDDRVRSADGIRRNHIPCRDCVRESFFFFFLLFVLFSCNEIRTCERLRLINNIGFLSPWTTSLFNWACKSLSSMKKPIEYEAQLSQLHLPFDSRLW